MNHPEVTPAALKIRRSGENFGMLLLCSLLREPGSGV